MAKPKRNIGLEILGGLQEIKRGEHARKTTLVQQLSAHASLHRLVRLVVYAEDGLVGRAVNKIA